MQRRPLLAGKSQPPEIWMEKGGRCSLRLILSRLWVEIRTHSAIFAVCPEYDLAATFIIDPTASSESFSFSSSVCV